MKEEEELIKKIKEVNPALAMQLEIQYKQSQFNKLMLIATSLIAFIGFLTVSEKVKVLASTDILLSFLAPILEVISAAFIVGLTIILIILLYQTFIKKK